MTQLRYKVSRDTESKLWSLKDDLQLLDKNPDSMYRSEFVRYMEVKAEQIYRDNLAKGMTPEMALKEAQVALNDDVAQWKAGAARKRARRTQ